MYPVERIGRYRLERRLGAGAFGVVWLAHDDDLDAPVAVKVLADNWAQRLDIRERFLSEARLLRRADSNRVVQVFDIGELPDDRPYFVMEYADGGTLADRLAGGPLPVDEALRLTALAALAAAALHAAGIVHRDIKPSNVLFRASPAAGTGCCWPTWGWPRAWRRPPPSPRPPDPSATRPRAGGTGDGHRPAGRCVQPGRPGLSPAHRYRPRAARQGRPARPAPPGPAADVQRALLRALEPDRERRWPTAAEFAAELERLAAPADLQAGGGTKPRRRGRSVAAVALAVTVALAGAAGATAAVLSARGDSGAARTTLRVADSTGRLSVEVPAQWGRQLRRSGWSPRTLGLADRQGPGLAVADDLSNWQNLDADANGVFAGLSEHGDLTAEVGALTHSGCHDLGTRDYRGTSWKGTVHSWSGCPGSEGVVTEAGLRAVDGGKQPQVYVQIRQTRRTGDSDEADRILDSVRIKD